MKKLYEESRVNDTAPRPWYRIRRLLVYLLGIAVLAFGIALNTKTAMGVAPVISVAYCFTAMTGIGLGVTSFLWYLVLILLQALLLGRNFRPRQLLQIGVSFLTSWFIGIFDVILPTAQNLAGRLLLLALAIVITALGIILTVGMRLVPNPADALADVLGQKLKRGLGLGKNVLDLSCIALSVCLGYLALGHLTGIGIGTILTMLLTGRVVALLNRWLREPCQRIAGCGIMGSKG